MHPATREILGNIKASPLARVLFIVLIVTNIAWLSFMIHIVTGYYRYDHRATDYERALRQTLAIAAITQPAQASREEIIRAVLAHSRWGSVHEQGDEVYVGNLVLRFDDQGLLIEILSAYDIRGNE